MEVFLSMFVYAWASEKYLVSDFMEFEESILFWVFSSNFIFLLKNPHELWNISLIDKFEVFDKWINN